MKIQLNKSDELDELKLDVSNEKTQNKSNEIIQDEEKQDVENEKEKHWITPRLILLLVKIFVLLILSGIAIYLVCHFTDTTRRLPDPLPSGKEHIQIHDPEDTSIQTLAETVLPRKTTTTTTTTDRIMSISTSEKLSAELDSKIGEFGISDYKRILSDTKRILSEYSDSIIEKVDTERENKEEIEAYVPILNTGVYVLRPRCWKWKCVININCKCT